MGRGRPVTVDCREAADALAEQAARVTALLRSVGRAEAAVVGGWNMADVAMHLSQAWIVVPGLAADDLSGVDDVVPRREATAGALIDDVWDLAGVTATAVAADPERDPLVLADRIEARAGSFLAGLGTRSPDQAHGWMVEGVTVDLATLVCHLLNETIVHGYDIARADGRPWPIPARHAALVLDGFLIPVIARLDPRSMVAQEVAAGVRATYEIHVRGGGRHLFAFHDGTLAVDPPGSRRVDCHISADPATFLLVAWGRRSQWPAIARGQLVAWGRKPWLGPRFRQLLRNP